jgi:hypothetical protein
MQFEQMADGTAQEIVRIRWIDESP